MKKISMMIIAVLGTITAAIAQVQPVQYQVNNGFNNQPTTHIQVQPNATWQNNSQFYNKDNQIDASKTYLTTNGQYMEPGYSNPINRNKYNGLVPNEPALTTPNVQFSTVLPVVITK